MAHLNAMGKSKKTPLEPGWVEAISRQHPDRPYFFNPDTGAVDWTPPVELDDKKKSERKSKKRKNNSEGDSEEFSDASPSIAKQLLNDITRPKLKAKSRNAANNNSTEAKSASIDTPAMRQIREKMAQKKKSVPKSTVDRKKAETPSRRGRRSSSVSSSSSSVASECSHASSASSMGTKITEAVQNACRVVSPSNDTGNKKLDKISQLPKIPKVNGSMTDKSKTNMVNGHAKTGGDKILSPPRKIMKKNIASERMSKLRKKLNTQINKDCSGAKQSGASLFNGNNNNESLDEKSCVQGNNQLEITNSELRRAEEVDGNQNTNILVKIDTSNLFCEEMEWEPIEDERIMSEIHTARLQLWEKPADASNDIPFNDLNSASTPGEKDALYIVIDTNVFLSNLEFIKEVRDSNSEVFGRPFIVIPWTVLQELDFIKDDKNNTRSPALKFKARKAVEFLNRHFNDKHPRFLGQTPSDVEENKTKFEIECPDDEILQTCLQIKESGKSPVLLSYDKNLCTKAMIHDVPILGRNDSLEKIYCLKEPEVNQFLSNSLHNHTEEKKKYDSISQQELLLADDIMEEGKAVLKSILSQVVAKEMENLFGIEWEKHVIIRPPWSVVTVLKCALKHWMAAVSESFEKQTERKLRDIQLCINNVPDGGRKLKDVKIFLSQFKDVIENLKRDKYPAFKEKVMLQVDDLIVKCTNLISEINKERFNESIGSLEEGEEEKRASLAFKVLEDIYAFARDLCGIAAESLKLLCSFSYNKYHPLITAKLAAQQKHDIAINVNRLVQILRVVLSNDYEKLCPNDKVVLALHQILVNFSSDLTFEELLNLTPMDLYCCIKLKRSSLEKGFQQLEELNMHFARMVNKQCKDEHQSDLENQLNKN